MYKSILFNIYNNLLVMITCHMHRPQETLIRPVLSIQTSDEA